MWTEEPGGALYYHMQEAYMGTTHKDANNMQGSQLRAAYLLSTATPMLPGTGSSSLPVWYKICTSIAPVLLTLPVSSDCIETACHDHTSESEDAMAASLPTRLTVIFLSTEKCCGKVL